MAGDKSEMSAQLVLDVSQPTPGNGSLCSPINAPVQLTAQPQACM